jgi:hypothetical protein
MDLAVRMRDGMARMQVWVDVNFGLVSLCSH